MYKIDALKDFFVFCFVITIIIRPLFFVGQTLYFQLNIDYIIETYCINKEKPELQCNGKCHLAQQLELIDANLPDNKDKPGILSMSELFLPLYLQPISEFKNEVAYCSLSGNLIISKERLYCFDGIDSVFHPPRLISNSYL